MGTASLGELAVRFGCSLQGDPDIRVTHVATLEHADPQSVAFLANPRYRRFLGQTRAGAVVLDAKSAAECRVPALIAKNPYATYARIAALLHPAPAVAAGRHPAAVIDPSAVVDPSASIGALAVIGARTRIGARCVVGPGSVLLDDVTIGADTRLVANVTLCSSVVVGERCLMHPGVVIGADGFGLAPSDGEWLKVPQVGGVRVGNDVEVGASTTIDRGAIEDTVIEDGVKLDNQIQIGHNVRIGAHTAIAGCTGISGSTTIGARCMLGGMVGVAGHLTICDDVVVTGRSFVNSSIRKPGYYSGGITVDEASRFRKNAARFHRLDELARQVRRLAGTGAEPPGDAPENE
ncbi:MAG TPA: UDP-3-O-(3-hydroxymyristoyl)glucosamine N-acyltransferase [Steroidobacteraceae bacterium]|nr:UDP-3-O-(3-hydroxymyristoyl)glucosamine N-acyltransferase [Steroidobacteraceae bacterium]